jgi:predicted permease
MREIRYTLRTLRKSPGFSLAAILVLALGIGANSAIFTVVRAVLLAPLPYPASDRLVNLYERDVIGDNPFNIVSAPNFYDWERDSTSFERMAFSGDWSLSFTPSDGGLPEVIDGALGNYNLFNTLGVQPALGRGFREEDDRPGAERVVVISDSFWRRRFGARPEAIGSQIRLDGELHTVVGVTPPGFDFPNMQAQALVPAWRVLEPATRQERGNHRFMVVARLKPGVSIEQARNELDGIARRVHQQYPEALTGRGANVVSMQERLVVRVRPLLLVLLGAVACVLLIACVNVANLLLARAVGRRREVAVRAALGAGRWQLARQFLTESLVLSTFGAAVGLVIAAWGTDFLVTMAGYIPRLGAVRMNTTVLAYTAGLAILTGVAVGLVPAFSSWRVGLAHAMQEGGRSSTAGRGGGRFRDALVAVEIALSLVLLIGAGLMLKSFAQLRSVDPGFSPEGILTIRFSLPEIKYKTPAQVVSFYQELVERVRTIPGVKAAGLVNVVPLAGHFSDETFTIEGRPALPAGQFLDAVVRRADPAYFQAIGIPIRRGRVFMPADRFDQANKAVISEAMAAQIFPNEDPIGKRIRTTVKGPAYEIVGVVANARQNLAMPAEPTMYFPILEGNFNFATLTVRASGDPNLLSLPIQKEMRRMDADLPAVTVKTMDDLIGGATSQNRFGLMLIALFACLAVTLAAIGLYGVLAYSIGQRTNEIGLRMALGATTADITGLVVRQGLKPAALGILLGLAAGAAVTRLLESVLFEVSATDPTVLVSVVALLTAVTCAACLAPAWRATRIDPVIALRAE